MEQYEYLSEVKAKQKELAKEIRKLKSMRKLGNRGKYPLWKIESKLYRAKYEYRHKHIAYCLIRGRSRLEIEQPKVDNLPNENYLQQLQEEYETVICVSAE